MRPPGIDLDGAQGESRAGTREGGQNDRPSSRTGGLRLPEGSGVGPGAVTGPLPVAARHASRVHQAPRAVGGPTLDPLRNPQALSPALRLRRAVYLMVLTLLVPGSAQAVAGNRRVARGVLGAWLALVLLALLAVVAAFLAPQLLVRLATNPLLLGLVAAACFAAALAWPALVVDTWRLTRPQLLPQRQRLAITLLTLACVLLTTLPLLGTGRRAWAAADLINGMFGAGTFSAAVDGRYNVLLLGGDAGPDRIGTRPDSMTLASIDAETGRTVLISLPRNLEDIPFPDSSPVHAALPRGWACGDSCLLNGLYTWGQEHRSLYPGVADPGAAVMKDAVEGITGLKVNYYVLVDLAGFRDVIDAMGGITVTVNERVPIGGGSSKVSGYIQPGTQHLDGYHALWFARSRHGASDYARMQRQRCVMNAMVSQLDPATLLSRFQQIAAASTRVMHTDLPAAELATFVDLGSKAKSHKISSVQFVPPLIDPAHPDYTVIRDRVTAAVDTAQQERDAPPARKAAAASGNAGTTGSAGTTGDTGTTGTTGSGAAAPATGGPSPAPSGGTDISSACSAG